IAAHDLGEWVARVAPDPAQDRVGHLAVAHSHPRWVVELLDEALADPDELEALLAADNSAPRVTLVARPGLATVAELEREGAPPPASRRTAWSWGVATPERSPRWRRAGPACRTRGPSWSRSPWPRPRWWAVTSGG